MNKFDSEYSALKALANSVGVTTPEKGWDSSYSIISSLYDYLIEGDSTGLSSLEMLTALQEGTENGEIIWSGDCSSEIARLNNIIVSLREELENCGSGGSSDCTEEIAELNIAIAELELQLQEASENADVALFSPIGYTKDNASSFFDYINEGIRYAEELKANWDYNSKISQQLNKSRLIFFPVLDGYNAVKGDKSLAYTFKDCTALLCVPYFDTSEMLDMQYMFNNCSSLISIPLLDTSSVTSMHYTFYGCSSLTSIPLLDTSSVIIMTDTFDGCSSLTSIPLLDTSSVTNMQYMFNNCSSLTSIPLLDTSSVTNMSNMFKGCSSLTSIPSLDTSSVTNIGYLFSNCTNLQSIPLLDFSSVTTISSFFGASNNTSLTDLGGFEGLKINWTGTGSLKMLQYVTVQSLLNVFNTIADVNDLGGRKLEIGTTNLNKLTDEQKAIATSKGWTLS